MFDRRVAPGSGATSARAGLDAFSTTGGQRSSGNASSPTRAIAATARKPLWVAADLDALLHAAAEQEHHNGQPILLITGGFSASRPAFRRRVEACLTMHGVVWTFECGGPVTDTELIPACVALMTERDVGLVAALGGGRVMDFAKVCTTFRDFDLSTDIELILGQRHDLIPSRRTPLITIPTTPGTGSEATPYAVLTGRRNRKLFAISAAFLPDAGLVCPELYVTVPPEVIRQGALDALTHALEALWAKRATQLSDAYAAQAMDHFHAAFLQFYRNPGDLRLAETVATGATLAGLAFASAYTSICHALSFPIAERLHLGHGQSCALTAAQVATFNADCETPALQRVARSLGLSGVDALPAYIRSFRNALDDRVTLASFGVTEEQVQEIVAHAHTDMVSNNLKHAGPVDLTRILVDSL